MTRSDVEVLLVEDDARDAELTLAALGRDRMHARAHVVRTGAEALEYMVDAYERPARYQAGGLRLILLDLKLPKIGGIEVLRRVKGDLRFRHIPVVILTSSRERRDIVDCYALGANSYVVKPVNFDDFVTCVSNIRRYWLECNEPAAS